MSISLAVFRPDQHRSEKHRTKYLGNVFYAQEITNVQGTTPVFPSLFSDRSTPMPAIVLFCHAVEKSKILEGNNSSYFAHVLGICSVCVCVVPMGVFPRVESTLDPTSRRPSHPDTRSRRSSRLALRLGLKTAHCRTLGPPRDP